MTQPEDVELPADDALAAAETAEEAAAAAEEEDEGEPEAAE